MLIFFVSVVVFRLLFSDIAYLRASNRVPPLMRSIVGMITFTREPKLNVASEDYGNARGEDREDAVCEPI